MRTVFFLLLCAGWVHGQTKISGVGKCSKPDSQQSVEVGDRPGHMLMVIKQSCTWATPLEMGGVKTKSYIVTVTSDASATRAQDRGYAVVTMENGDKAYVQFQGSAMMK